MKYKIGDKVKIKTWREMREEFGINEPGEGIRKCGFVNSMENIINKNFPDRILTIRKIETSTNDEYYRMEGDGEWLWREGVIKYSLREKKIEEEKTWIPIDSRFEILDL